MRVTLVTETYFPQVNGVSRTLGQLVRCMTEAGDEVQVVHPNYGDPPATGTTHLGPAFSLPFYKELYLPRPPFGKVFKAIDAFEPDIIHIATEATLGLSALRHVLARRIPVVSSFHTNFDQYTDHYRVGFAKGWIWRYLRWFHNRTIETYVPSLTTIRELESKGFERLVLWPRGVDANLFRPDREARASLRESLGFQPDDVVIGYVSRIAAEKNIHYLAQALERVERDRPAVRFLFVGDGPSRPDLEKRLGPRAKFVGYKSGEDLADHYSAADIFAFTSKTETFGNVVLEAMASGLPVVALRAGGVGDTIRHDETGLLVGSEEPPAVFADALLSLIDNQDRRRRLGQGARDYAQSQSWDHIMQRLRERYVLAIERQSQSNLQRVIMTGSAINEH